MTTKPSNVAPGVQAQQTVELRQQVNSEPQKERRVVGDPVNGRGAVVWVPAQVIGKIDLKPRKEVVVQKQTKAAVKQFNREVRVERPKQMKRSDDNRAQIAGNQAMLQELQFVKGKLKAAETELATTRHNATFFRLQLKCLIEQVLAAGTSEGVTRITAEPSFQELVKYVGAEAPAAV